MHTSENNEENKSSTIGEHGEQLETIPQTSSEQSETLSKQPENIESTEREPLVKQEKTTKTTSGTFTCGLRILKSDRERWENFRNKHNTIAEAFSALLDLAERKPETIEKTIEVEKEVIREVPIQLNADQCLVNMNEKQQKAIEIIATKRAAKRGEHDTEDPGQILLKAFFTPGRLFNLDNEFYTGLSKKDIQ